MATLDKVTIKSPATIANLGPGFDVLGLAVDGLYEVLEAKLVNGPSIVKEVTGVDAELVPLNPIKNTATYAADHFFKLKKLNYGIEIAIRRAFPISGGLGSSSVSSLAGAMAAAYLTGNEKSEIDILTSALNGEALVSGFHLDNVAPCYYGGVTLVLSTDPIEVVSIKAPESLWISLVTPKMKLETKKAREVLPISLPQKEWVAEMAKTAALVSAISTESHSLIKSVFSKPSYAEIYRGPLISGFPRVKELALKEGALGVSISGAGPTIFALSDSKNSAEAIKNAMAEGFGDISFSYIGKISNQGAFSTSR